MRRGLGTGAPRRSGPDARRSASRHGRHAGVGRHARAVYRIQGLQRRLPRARRAQPRVDDGFVKSVVSTSGLPIGYQRTGTLEVATSREHMAELEDLADRSEGPRRRAPPARCARGASGGTASERGRRRRPAHRNARLCERGRVDACAGLAARCQGASAIEGHGRGEFPAVQTASSWRRPPGRCQPMLSCLPPAAGPRSSKSRASPGRPVRPVRGQLAAPGVARSPAPARALGRALLHGAVGGRHAPRRRDDGRGGVRRADDGSGRQRVARGVCALVPEAADAGFLSARAGLRPGSPDAMPIVGPSRAMEGLVYATGHFRNGVLLAPVTAQLVADAMLSGRIDPALEAIGPQRFEGL